MRVYQINVTARFSTGTIAKNIHKALVNRGDEARFAYGFGGEAEQGFYQITNLWHLRIEARVAQLTGREGTLSGMCTQKLIRDIKEFAPDMIHLHNIHGSYIDYKMLLEALAEYGRPVVITLHDCWMFTGGCYHFFANGCEKWEKECRQCAYQQKYVLRKVTPIEETEFHRKKKLLQSINALYVTTVSDWLAGVTKKSFLKDRVIRTVPNGIDTGIFRKKNVDELRRTLNCEGKKVLLGVASTWSERKGLNKWIELSNAVNDHYQIILVGLNSAQMDRLPAKMIGLPRVADVEELVSLYNLADIYINLSAEETFGLPTAEAMACGTPVIVLNATANPELVNDDVGRVAETSDHGEIMRHIEELCGIGKEQMRDACVKRAETLYSIKAMTEKYLQLYDEIWQEESERI